jgi:hypothetical protein
MSCSVEGFPHLAAFLAGSPREWSDLEISEKVLLDLCAAEDLAPLCFHRLTRGSDDGWPRSLRRILAESAHARVAEELLRRSEIRAVLDALALGGISPILIKGTPLAYTVYEAPACRARDDTDLIIPESDVDAARRVMASLGYSATVHCSDLFSQFEVQKIDRFGVTHAFDIHWKISTQPVFQSVLTHREIMPRAEPLPALGPHAMAAGPVDALLLACVHPVMHHRNAQRVLWIYDIHLLAGRLSAVEFNEFADLAHHKQMAAVCAHQLRFAQTVFGTAVPPSVLAALSEPGEPEPSAAYLASERGWRHELASSLGGLPRVADRVKLLRHVLLPDPSYMLGAYGLRGKSLGPWLLPVLYVHRNVRGVWKILMGKK